MLDKTAGIYSFLSMGWILIAMVPAIVLKRMHQKEKYHTSDSNRLGNIKLESAKPCVGAHLDQVMFPATGGRFREIGGSCFCFS